MWFVATALAAELSPCAEDPGVLPEALSVAWVSPVRKRVGRHGWLDVVPTSELTHWAAAEQPSTGRLLQRLGLRRKAEDPKRRWKVTIFDARSADLIGCWTTIDTANQASGLHVYELAWRDAALRGFCVLPADRFVAEAAGR